MLSRLYQGSFPLSPYLIQPKRCYVNMCDQELLRISIQEVKESEHELFCIFCTKKKEPSNDVTVTNREAYCFL
jgi:hypothetical protein